MRPMRSTPPPPPSPVNGGGSCRSSTTWGGGGYLGPLPRLRGRVRVGAVLALVAIALLALDQIYPPPIPDVTRDGATIVLARDGTPLRAFADERGVWRYP